MQRSVWPLYILAEKKSELLLPYLPALAEILNETGHHPSVHRNITGIFQYAPLSNAFVGKLLISSFNLLESPQTPVATKVNCITILKRLSKAYPEIIPELKLIIADQLRYQTASFRARAKTEKLL